MDPNSDYYIFVEIWDQTVLMARAAAVDALAWMNQRSDVERVAGLGLFIASLLGLALLVPDRNKKRRSNSMQFAMAFVLVIGASVGLGWRFAERGLPAPPDGLEIARFWQDSGK